MKESEQPIRHQKDPKLTEPKVKTLYKRQGPGVDARLWIPLATDDESLAVFPWQLDTSVDGKSPQPKINWEYATQIDQEETTQMYGEWKGEESLSPVARKHLGTLRFVYDRLTHDLVANDGAIENEVLFEDQKLDAFLDIVEKNILSDPHNRYGEQDLEYVLDQLKELNEQFKQAWLEAASHAPAAKESAPVVEHVDPHRRRQQQLISADFAIQLALNPAGSVLPHNNPPTSPQQPTNFVSQTQLIIDRIQNRRFEMVSSPTNEQFSDTLQPKSALRHVSGGRTV